MNVYLLETDSKVLLDEEIKKRVKNASNQITYSLKDTTITDILEEASYVSMFQEMKWIIVKNADFFAKEKLSEKEQATLLRYLEHPYPLTTILFTTYEEVDKRKLLFKKIQEQQGYFSFKAPKGYELVQETKKMIKQKGYQVDEESVKYLLEACQNSWDLIHKEVEKFELFFDRKGPVSLKELKQIVSSNPSDNQFKFVQAVMEKDAATAFKLLEDLLLLKIDVLQLLHLMVREYRMMLIYKILEKKNYLAQDILKELKIADWQLSKIQKNCVRYHMDDLKDALVSLSKMDYQIKSGQQEKLMALQCFLIEQFQY